MKKHSDLYKRLLYVFIEAVVSSAGSYIGHKIVDRIESDITNKKKKRIGF